MATREELIAIIATQQAQIEALLVRVEELEEEVRQLRQGKGGGAGLAVKPSKPEKEFKPRKRRDRAFVRGRETADEVVHHAVGCCPDCGRRLQGGWEHGRHQVLEVVVQRRVIDHVIWARRCGICRKRWLPKLHSGEIGAQGKPLLASCRHLLLPARGP